MKTQTRSRFIAFFADFQQVFAGHRLFLYPFVGLSHNLASEKHEKQTNWSHSQGY